MEKKTEGAWLVQQTSKLQNVNNQTSYENTYFAGKAGILLSALTADEQCTLPKEKVNALAQASNITVSMELPALLDVLENRELISVGSDGIEVLGVTTASTLQHTADIFYDRSPTSFEKAALHIAETCSNRPHADSELKEEIADTHKLSKDEVNTLCNESEQIGFVDVERVDSTKSLYFNGNLFRRETTNKVHTVLSSLADSDQVKLHELNDLINKSACVTTDTAKSILGAQLFAKVSSIGLYDVSVVSNTEEQVGYVTQPSAFSKYSDSLVDDAFDLAKAFVSSLTYGMTRSNYERGAIRMVETLLRTLIRGESIGPVTAIGNDYKILEVKGVVQVFEGSKKGRTGHMMKLLKREVGILALEVIEKGDASELSLESLPTSIVTQFSGPEQTREHRRRKQVERNPADTNDILLALRTGQGFK